MDWMWVGWRFIPWTTCLFLDNYRTNEEKCRLFADFWYYEEPTYPQGYYDSNTGYNYYDDYY
jgi:hypothetical protein